MFWTAPLLAKIAKIISDTHAAIAVTLYGPKTVDPAILADLKKQGLVPKTPSGRTVSQTAYEYGMAMARGDEVEGMSAEEFEQHVEDNPIPLGEFEKQAIDVANARAGQYVVGLGNRVNLRTGAVAIEADGKLRAKMRGIIRDTTARRIAERESIAEMKSNLGWESGDWTRDMERIANTESMNALNEGVAASLNNRGPEQRAAKLVSPDCCPTCRELYCEPDGRPRIFLLAELESNGSNVGKKRGEWLATVGVAHPHCACTLISCPAGFEFDEDGNLKPIGENATPLKGTRKRKEARKSLYVRKGASTINLVGPYGAVHSPAGDRNPGGIEGGTAAALMFTPPKKPGRNTLQIAGKTGKLYALKRQFLPHQEVHRIVTPREELMAPQGGDARIAQDLKNLPKIPVDKQAAADNKRRALSRMSRQIAGVVADPIRNASDDAILQPSLQVESPPPKRRKRRHPL